mmetsp:Transcript_2429/g.6916  ORF Transcript_2429/g.6916 Transcript_2429/m.6916 type:complete len:298 (+) Transcript_2429:557-1450(+)
MHDRVPPGALDVAEGRDREVAVLVGGALLDLRELEVVLIERPRVQARQVVGPPGPRVLDDEVGEARLVPLRPAAALVGVLGVALVAGAHGEAVAVSTNLLRPQVELVVLTKVEPGVGLGVGGGAVDLDDLAVAEQRPAEAPLDGLLADLIISNNASRGEALAGLGHVAAVDGQLLIRPSKELELPFVARHPFIRLALEDSVHRRVLPRIEKRRLEARHARRRRIGALSLPVLPVGDRDGAVRHQGSAPHKRELALLRGTGPLLRLRLDLDFSQALRPAGRRFLGVRLMRRRGTASSG